MHSSSRKFRPQRVRPVLGALLGLLAFFAAGCHNNNEYSGYGITWVTLTDEPGDFTSYIVNIDSITLTRNDGAVVTALATAETVDFTKLANIAEMWGSGTIATGTYLSASIVLDYTSAVISVLINGQPQRATVVDAAGAAVTTVTINVIFDPANPLTLLPTYATTAAQRLALDLDLAASTRSIYTSAAGPTVVVQPYMTAGISAPDTKLIRVRGPLINSSANLGTYSVYVRPFHDVEDSLGTLTLFNSANTVYTIDGKSYVGAPGISALSQTSAGTTETAAYATFEPTATPTATAGKFNAQYVVAGGSLEDVYTSGLEGDVIARSGNTLTLRGSSLTLNDGITTYNAADAVLLVGPATIVTTDDDPALTGLNYNSIGVGQHVIARGIYTAVNSGVNLDATGSSSTDTGSVRLMPTDVVGSLISAAAGNVVLNLTTINDWPVSIFNFAGSGLTAASAASPLDFTVSTGALAIPGTTAGDTSWVTGLVTPFGSAPPDFLANAINTEATEPASLQVYWTGPATAPFSVLAATGLTVDLANTALSTAVLRLGSASINLSSLPASPLIVPAAGTAPGTTTSITTGAAIPIPATFTPLFSVGDPTAVAPLGISVYSVFSSYVAELTTVLPTAGAVVLDARGTYNRATNTFTATSVNVVL